MKKMKKMSFILFLTTIILLVLFIDLSSQQTEEELFEKALYTEEAQGDLQKAIGLYEQILKQFPDNREIAAKAQLHIGLCYEKLGLQEAPKAYQKVLDDFPEQKEIVKVAQEKLSMLRKAQSVIAKVEKEFNIRKVWAGPGTDILGEPSPDGKYMSYVDWNTGDLAIRDLATGKNRRLTSKGSWVESPEFALFSKWSPDSKRIVYNWANEKESFDLRIVGLDSTKPQILSCTLKEMAYWQPFGWSPDGKSILAASNQEEKPLQLGLISVADGSFHILKDISGREWAGYPPVITFSPDGKYLVYDYPQDEDTQKRDIFIMSVEDKIETPLIRHPMNETLLGWAPDGKWIFFARGTGTGDAWIVGVDNGALRPPPKMIKKDMGFIVPLGFTQNGNFYYGVNNRMNDIYSIQIDSDTGKILSPPKKATLHYEGSNRYPAYSKDGKYLAYVSTRGPGPVPRSVLCIRDVQSGKERELYPELKGFTSPRWSPDGRFISVEVGDSKDNLNSIYRIDAQTGVVDPIIKIEPELMIFSHRWSKDGKTIFYTKSEPGAKVPYYRRKSHIYMYDIASGRDTVLPGSPSDAKDIDISPDGRWLVLLNRDERRVLRVIPALGGESRILYSFEDQGFIVISPTWVAGGRYILFYQGKTDSDEPSRRFFELVQIPVEGGELQGLGLEMNEFRHFSAHPDGQQIVFHSRGSEARWPEVWVMENFLPKK
ncbi:MAG: PD40 domain-containing protein [Candidatus Aminicenantes bacterium]|nr:MAG: PD40 domain-containing protein [Candidatus Aminicenantes bacterium]